MGNSLNINKMKKYTKEEFLKAAEIGEVSMVNAKNIVSFLDEARHSLRYGFDCYKCKHSFSNPFDQYYCQKTDKNGGEYDLENNKDCGGIYYDL